MQRKLTISIAEDVYDGLYAKVGPRKIGKFLEGLARPHVVEKDEAALEAEYAAMAADEEREAEAALWMSIAGETLPPDPLYDEMWAAEEERIKAEERDDANASR